MRMILAYIVVLGVLAVAGFLVVKKLLPRLGVAGPAGKRISVIETAYLAPRKAVLLLRVGSRKILVASTREGLAMLADVTDAIDEQTEVGD